MSNGWGKHPSASNEYWCCFVDVLSVNPVSSLLSFPAFSLLFSYDFQPFLFLLIFFYLSLYGFGKDIPPVTSCMSSLSSFYSESVKKLRSSHFRKSLHVVLNLSSFFVKVYLFLSVGLISIPTWFIQTTCPSLTSQ